MGIIKRQGIKGSIVQYIGSAMGVISTFLIYPLAIETYGFTRFIMDTAMFWGPFIALGAPAVAVRFFPGFKDESNGHNGLLGILLIWVLLGSILMGLIAITAWDVAIAFYKERSALIENYLWVSVLLAVVLSFIGLFQMYISNFKRIVVPLILNQLIRFTLPLAILLWVYGLASYNTIVLIVLLNYIVMLSVLVIYLWMLGQLKFNINLSFFTNTKLRSMGVYALYGVFGSLGSILATRIDTIMVGSMIDLTNTGIYAIAMSMVNLIIIPFGAITGIAAPIISQAIKDDNFAEVKMIYQKSSLNLLVIGFLVFLLLWLSLDDIFSLMKNSDTLKAGKYVVFFLGVAKLIDLGTSVNSHIISFSKYFRVNFYTILCLAVFNVVFNITMIPLFGIVGAAIATMASLTLFNLVKVSFIQYKFNIQPFTIATGKLLLICGLLYAVFVILPIPVHPFFAIILRSVLFGLAYGFLILYLKVSPDLNNLFFDGLEKVKSIFR